MLRFRQHVRFFSVLTCPSQLISRRFSSVPPPPLGNVYEPEKIEKRLYDSWERQGLFKANNSTKKFSMLLPPPNVTGALHIGHALTVTIQDIMARWHGLQGYSVSWIPGLDHAGIATQVIVEKQLMKSRGLTRHQLGRDQFLEEVWKWKAEYGHRITGQLRRMGASLDWSKEYFTMDSQRSEAVVEAFIRLHEQGLIHRATRLVNWCPALNTAISDIEVDMMEVGTPTMIQLPPMSGSNATGSIAPPQLEVGVIYAVAYRVNGGRVGDELVVHTTRPETLFGDVAIAIHPADPRYLHLHGKEVIHPITGRLIPIICDDVLVKMDMGTGAVKVTPAHDPDDFHCGKRSYPVLHQLPEVDVLTDSGHLNTHSYVDIAFQGMHRFAAREAVVAALTAAGAFRGKLPHATSVPRCSRTGDVVEPRLKPQWFVRTESLATAAAGLARKGDLRFLPDGAGHKETWLRWLDAPQDWCISRQLWWGHRIPAYRVVMKQGDSTPAAERWVVAPSATVACATAEERFGLAHGSFTVEQDEDVLDTWFSSGLSPLATFGWPRESEELQEQYPLSVMETGADILFFWVARMVMLCSVLRQPFEKGSPFSLDPKAFAANVPFRTILLHPMVRDASGAKMSKSLGNVIDPLHLIDAEFSPKPETGKGAVKGKNQSVKAAKTTATAAANATALSSTTNGADALRLALALYMGSRGAAIHMDPHQVTVSHQFGNKLWQASKYVMFAAFPSTTVPAAADLGEASAGSPSAPIGAESADVIDHWILHRFRQLILALEDAMASQELNVGVAAATVRAFWLRDFCAVHIEMSKLSLRSGPSPAHAARSRAILAAVLDLSLRATHPFMPFITEELWLACAPAFALIHSLDADGAQSDTLARQLTVLREGCTAQTRAEKDASCSIMRSLLPRGEQLAALEDPQSQVDMACVLAATQTYRALRATFGPFLKATSATNPLVLFCGSGASDVHSALSRHLRLLQLMIKVEHITVVEQAPSGGFIEKALSLTSQRDSESSVDESADMNMTPIALGSTLNLSAAVGACRMYVALQQSPALDAHIVQMAARLKKGVERHEQFVARCAGAAYEAATPAAVKAEHVSKIAQSAADNESLARSLEQLRAACKADNSP